MSFEKDTMTNFENSVLSVSSSQKRKQRSDRSAGTEMGNIEGKNKATKIIWYIKRHNGQHQETDLTESAYEGKK